MVSWWGGRGGQGLGHINAVPPRPRRNRCACNFVAGHCVSDRRLVASSCTQKPYDLRGVSLFVSLALALAPNSHTTSPCGGCRSLFFARQRRLTRRKPPCRGQSNKALGNRWFRRTASGSAGICRYRPVGHRNGMTHGFRRGAPDLVCGAHLHICRYRREAPRRFARQWFRGGGGAVVRACTGFCVQGITCRQGACNATQTKGHTQGPSDHP